MNKVLGYLSFSLTDFFFWGLPMSYAAILLGLVRCLGDTDIFTTD